MSALTNSYEHILGNLVLRNTPHTPSAGVWIALFTASPGEDGVTTSEVSGGAYARQPLTFAAPVDGEFTNSGEIAWPIATAAWGTISHFAVMTAETGGDMILYGQLLDVNGAGTTKTIQASDQLKIASGSLKVTFS